MSIVLRVAIPVCMSLLLGGCSSSQFDAMQAPVHSIVDKLPEWAGGPPKGLPPRPTDPGYAAYLQQVEGRAVVTPTAEQANLSALH